MYITKLYFTSCDVGDAKVYNFSSEETISLIDAGAAIISAYPLILHPERDMKLILSFDFSNRDPFEVSRFI